jgi:pimeloyl-ACP methyl ester carboxylesterase
VLYSLADGRIMGRRFGLGTPVVLALHGWARTHRDFDAVLGTAGQPELDALAIDLPGFGVAARPPEPWGTPEYADFVVQVLPEMSKRVVLLGHSFGGRVAVQLAATHPESVAALVLSGVPDLVRRSARPKAPAGFRFARRLHRHGLVSDRRIESLRQRHGSADYQAADGIMRDVLVRTLAESYTAPLDAITCPISLVWGSDDTSAPVWVAEELARVHNATTLTVCEGAGHLTPLTVPEVLRQAVVDHLP